MVGFDPLFIVYLVVFLLGFILELFLTGLNLRHLKKYGHTVPASFEGYVDRRRMAAISDYTQDHERYALLTFCVGSAAFLVVVASGVLVRVVAGIEHFHLGTVLSGLVFFAVLGAARTLFFLPFDYYQTFVIEARHGFNTSTPRTWMTDVIKNMVIGAVLGGLLVAAVLALIEYGGNLWWLWAWVVFFLFQLLMLMIYPTVIAPWFNKFVPLDDPRLEEKVCDIMKQGGLSVEGVFRMDAGKRSRHTNAYFTGLGKTKRIVLFDTLLAAHGDDEILAILAHEIGHWRKRHIQKMLLLVGGLSLLLFYVASLCIKWTALYDAFGFHHQVSYVGIFLFGALWEAVSQFFSPIANILSRVHEREADVFAVRLLGKSKDLVCALKNIAKDNLSNLCPHPLYAWFHYSHPPLPDRIRYLEREGAHDR
jgi:STE24 endopeptidase